MPDITEWERQMAEWLRSVPHGCIVPLDPDSIRLAVRALAARQWGVSPEYVTVEPGSVPGEWLVNIFPPQTVTIRVALTTEGGDGDA